MNKEALEAVNKIVGFRSLNNEIETIINKSESIKKTKTEKEERLTPTEAKELSDEEKEIKSMRKQIQEKLIKFATRIPVFMYLSDFREYCLRDVIQELEPELFKRVTGRSTFPGGADTKPPGCGARQYHRPQCSPARGRQSRRCPDSRTSGPA